MPRSQATDLDDDLDDDLDGVMGAGMGGKKNEVDDFFGGAKKNRPQTSAPQRDTLGFLQRADEEKKAKAEQKKQKELEAAEAYKNLD